MRTKFSILAASCFALAALTVSTAHAQWIQSLKHADVAYFLFGTSPRLERYSLTTGGWLAPFNLPTAYGSPTVFHIDADGLYVAYGQAVKRYTLSASNEVHLLNTVSPVLSIFSDGNILLINRSSDLYARFTTLNKTNDAIIADFENYIYSPFGAAIAPSINKIFGRSRGISPSDITYVRYNDDGTFGGGGDSPHHGDYPNGSRVWVFPGDAKVVDDSGTVYSTGDLSFLNSFGAKIDDLDFYGADIPIVLRSNTLVAYSNSLLPTGSRSLAYTPGKIYVSGTNVLTFTSDSTRPSGIRVDAVPLSTLNPPTPGEPVNPNGVAYTPDYAFLDKDRILYLLSKSHQSLFRWDTLNQRYLVSIPLLEVPSYVAYSEANHKIYLAYPAGLIRQIDLARTNFVETPFANLPDVPLGLSTAGPYVFAADPSGAWETHHTFDSAGNRVASVDWNYYSTEYIWSPVNQLMYFLRDDTSPNDLHAEAINADGTVHTSLPPGGIGVDIETPLHGDGGFMHPIRVAPDGSVVVLGSGRIYDAKTLAPLSTSLANSITDAAWTSGGLRTVRTISNVAQFQQWNGANYAQGVVRQFPGSAHRLFGLNTNHLVAITIHNSTPAFYVMDGNFNIVPPPTLQPPANLRLTVASTSQINLSWNDVNGEEFYSVERKTGASGAWGEVGSAAVGVTNFTDTSVTLGNVYYYRVIARNGTRASPPSAEMSVSLVIPATPTSVTALALSSSSIRVTWGDVAAEAIYQLERRTGALGAWNPLTTLSADTTSFTDAGLMPNTEYFYRLRAANGIGSSAFSTIVSARTAAVPPTTPFLASATPQGPFAVMLIWSDSSYEDDYVIERRSGSSGPWSVIATLPQGSTAFTDQTVSSSTTYEYRLYATNAAGPSGYSIVRTVTTPQIQPPAAPAALAATSLSNATVLVTWSDVATETGYRLERRHDDLNSWAVIAVLASEAMSYFDTNVLEGVQYWYRVQAFNANGNSQYSNQDDVVPMRIVVLIADDFDPNIDPSVWAAISGGVATNGGQGFRSSRALYFGGSASRSAATVPVDVSTGGIIEFTIRAGNEAVDGDAFWNNSEAGEGVVLEYSRDGANWSPFNLNLSTIYPSASNWVSFSVPIPSIAFSPTTQFRWRQLTHSGPASDCWALEDVAIHGSAPLLPEAPPFLISSASSSTSIAILWIGAQRAARYVIERRLSSEAWAAVATVPGTVTYFTDTSVAPSSAYSYRVKAANASGDSPYSPVTTSFTWSQIQQWANDNFGNPDAMNGLMTAPNDDGTLPLLRYAFNLNSDESPKYLAPSQTSGFPAIWLDSTRNRLSIEFVRRKASMNPGITYRPQFCNDLWGWQDAPAVLTTTSIDSIWERVRYEDSVPANQAAARFGRVIVTVE